MLLLTLCVKETNGWPFELKSKSLSFLSQTNIGWLKFINFASVHKQEIALLPFNAFQGLRQWFHTAILHINSPLANLEKFRFLVALTLSLIKDKHFCNLYRNKMFLRTYFGLGKYRHVGFSNPSQWEHDVWSVARKGSWKPLKTHCIPSSDYEIINFISGDSLVFVFLYATSRLLSVALLNNRNISLFVYWD